MGVPSTDQQVVSPRAKPLAPYKLLLSSLKQFLTLILLLEDVLYQGPGDLTNMERGTNTRDQIRPLLSRLWSWQ